MPKRKREEDAGGSDRASGMKQQRVQYKLQLGVIKLGHAFKTAKGFERQKLGRRRKTAVAQRNEKDVERIDAEIAALKTLNTSASAQHHLYKTLLKIKSISEHRDLPPKAKKSIKISSDPAALNVNARLCKSNTAKEALAGAVGEVQRALGLQVDSSQSLKKRRLRAKDLEGTTSRVSSGQPHDRNASEAQVLDDEELAQSDREDEQSEEDFADFDGRIAASSDEDPDSDQSEQQLAEKSALTKSASGKSNGYDIEADLSISGSDSGEESESPEPQKAPLPKRSFLPALTMGGYISGSGSDIDDDVDVAPRMNRRGQRARQQIWEKKFGTKAKHLHQQDRKQDRNQGWHPKLGAVDGSNRHGKGRTGTKTGQSNARIPDKPKKKHRDDSGSIHPSWEAAKKAKEKKNAPVAFQGKKITFD